MAGPFPGSVLVVESEAVSGIPGVEGWGYGAFARNTERACVTVPLRREDGTATEFTVPDFVGDPEDVRQIAAIVIGALEKWDRVKGLGA